MFHAFVITIVPLWLMIMVDIVVLSWLKRSMKVVSYGLLLHADSFMRSGFNLLDILVVGVSLVSFGLK